MYCKIATVTRHAYYIRITLANTKRPVFFNLLPTFRPLIYIRAIDADNAAVIVRSIEKRFCFVTKNWIYWKIYLWKTVNIYQKTNFEFLFYIIFSSIFEFQSEKKNVNDLMEIL